MVVHNKSFYIDKTRFVEEIINNNPIKLFTRPRIFGKSLNMSMLRYFFDIENHSENRELFRGLYIENSKCMKKQGKYPVIFISFKEIKEENFEKIENEIGNLFAQIFK